MAYLQIPKINFFLYIVTYHLFLAGLLIYYLDPSPVGKKTI